MRWRSILVAAVICAGCDDSPTEVRMVIETDLGAQELGLVVIAPLGAGTGPSWAQADPQFPFVVAVTADAQRQPFNINVLLRPDASSQLILVFRNARDVAFVAGQKRMFVMPMLAKCRCQGTACPDPGDPECDDLRAPALAPLDARAEGEPDMMVDMNFLAGDPR